MRTINHVTSETQGLFSAGSNNMNDILINRIDDAILSHAKRNIDSYELYFRSLYPEVQNEIVTAYRLGYDEDISECLRDPITGATYDDVNHYILKSIQNSYRYADELARVIKKHVVNYHAEDIQDLIDKRCEYLHEEKMDSAGFVKVCDRNNDEYTWRKTA